MYRITGLIANKDRSLGGHGFCIVLPPDHKKFVANCDMDQTKVNNWLKVKGKQALLSCGYKEERIDWLLGSIQVKWGEWGIEHMSVPGNACGLDIDYHPFGIHPHEREGVQLTPHNIDSYQQKLLLITIFCEITDWVYHGKDEQSK